ncbi:hypothetical protein AAP_00979 [Ascosphaera apis ARSEF 7405]|uniref:Uncharacterized protein n=1 Tax=Ascosphaera apis ARSEF 7405 TaxID=392613 RepID=A0A168C6K8_9EURO|nr:hypothetical protein AAP_00979 [Ascosphaera apis ARSEF 7405]
MAGSLFPRAFSALARATEYKEPEKPKLTKAQKHLRRAFLCFIPRVLVMLTALITMGYEIHDSLLFRDRGRMDSNIAATVMVAASVIIPCITALLHAFFDEADMYDSVKVIRYCAGTFHLLSLIACLVALGLNSALPPPRLKSGAQLDLSSCQILPSKSNSDGSVLSLQGPYSLCADSKWTSIVICILTFWEAMEYHLFATAAVYW